MVFLADSNNFNPRAYDLIFQDAPPIDVLFMGMECVGAPVSWVYGPLFHNAPTRKNDQARRLNGSNSEKALKIIQSIKPQQVYIYAMGLEEWMSYILALNYTDESPAIVESNHVINHCKQMNIVSKRLYLQESISI